ncbi:MAG TPA: hypothetical protein VME86_02215 [Acidobacteriaceae bacterium]|nr:hypothetical protein [Acidobacteriaceae bacterium]
MKENYDEQIDRTLRMLGTVEPAAGMEERIIARLEYASEERKGLFRMPQLVFGLAAAAVGCAVIVVGSVNHSHHILPVAPGLQVPGITEPGIGAASGARVAPQPVTALPQDRPRSVREESNGRAVISPTAKKRAGVAVPKTLPMEPAGR